MECWRLLQGLHTRLQQSICASGPLWANFVTTFGKFGKCDFQSGMEDALKIEAEMDGRYEEYEM